MNIVDTSGWLEYFVGSQNAKKFAAPIKETEELLVPTICIYEISKIILRESDENHLLQALEIFLTANAEHYTAQTVRNLKRVWQAALAQDAAFSVQSPVPARLAEILGVSVAEAVAVLQGKE